MAFLFSTTQMLAATLDQFLPWLTPNHLALGTPSSAFVKAHPLAQELFSNERRPGEPFNGGLAEKLPDGSIFLYGFADDRLASVNWATGSRDRTAERLPAVRNALIRVHGQPTAEYAARVDSTGSIAHIVREVYRPTIDQDYVICLLGTSEGVEVALTNEELQRKRGIKTSRETYEEAVRAVSTVVKPNEQPSKLVDFLAAEREKAETPQPDANPKPPIPQPPTPSTQVPTTTLLPSTPVARIAESPAVAAEHRAPVWLWVIGIAALTVIALLARKRRSN